MSLARVLLFFNGLATIGLLFLLLQHEIFLPEEIQVQSPTLHEHTKYREIIPKIVTIQPKEKVSSPCVKAMKDKVGLSLDQDNIRIESSIERVDVPIEKQVDKFIENISLNDSEKFSTSTWPSSLPPKALLTSSRNKAEARCSQLIHMSPPKKCQVYYMHTHKSGGSTLCSLAQLNGYNVDLPNNCQEMDGDKRLTWWKWSTWKQAELFRDSKHNFISNEDNTFIDPPLPGAFIYIITVRHPLDRILSHFRHHRKDHKLTNFSFATFSNYYPKPADYWASNWYVQLLGGGSGNGCFGRGYNCGYKELNIAISRLQGYFSLVLITDSPLHFKVGGMLMRHKFGWLASSDTDKARRGTHVESHAVSELQSSPSSYVHLVATNSIDLQFYDVAKQLFQESSQELFLNHIASSEKSDESSNTKLLSNSEANDLFELLSLKKEENKQFSMKMNQANEQHQSKSKNGYVGLALSPQASSFKDVAKLGKVIHDRSGFGGHNDICKGMGILSVESCRTALLKHPGCDTLSYKDSKCFLHDSSISGFYTDKSLGHWSQTKLKSS